MRFSFFALLVLALGTVNPMHAQSELEVFSEMGDAFTLYLNQMKMNEEPAPRVLVEVNAGFYQVRIDFEESGRADLFKNNFGTEAGMRTTGKITMNRKGEFVLRPFGHVPMSQAPAAPASMQAPSSGVTQTTTINTQGATSPAGQGGSTTDQVNMSVNIGSSVLPGGINMNVQMSATESWSTTESTTATSSWEETTSTSTASAPAAMDDLDFEDYLAAIKAKTFEDSKQSTAEAPLKAGAMLSAGQIARVMKAFDFEATRVDFAVFAHAHCVDPHNYYKTHGAFEFELSIDELNEAIGQ